MEVGAGARGVECSNSGSVAGCACVTCGGVVVRHLLTDYDGPLRRPQAPDLALLQTHLLPSCPQSKGRPIIIQLNLKGTLDGSQLCLGRIVPTKPFHLDLGIFCDRSA